MSNCIFLHRNFKINPKKGYQSQKNSRWDGQKESLDGGGRLTVVWFTLQFSRFICICVILVIHVHSTACGYAWGRESQRRLLKIECEIDLKLRGRKGKWEGGSHSPLFPGQWQHLNSLNAKPWLNHLSWTTRTCFSLCMTVYFLVYLQCSE